MRFKEYYIEKYIFTFEVAGRSGSISKSEPRWRVLNLDKKKLQDGFHSYYSAKSFVINHTKRLQGVE